MEITKLKTQADGKTKEIKEEENKIKELEKTAKEVSARLCISVSRASVLIKRPTRSSLNNNKHEKHQQARLPKPSPPNKPLSTQQSLLSPLQKIFSKRSSTEKVYRRTRNRLDTKDNSPLRKNSPEVSPLKDNSRNTRSSHCRRRSRRRNRKRRKLLRRVKGCCRIWRVRGRRRRIWRTS